MASSFPAYVAAVSKSVSDAVSSLPSMSQLTKEAQGISRAVSESMESSSKLINKFDKEYCPSCHKELSIGIISGVAYGKEFQACVCCNRRFCANCCNMSTCPIAKKLWHPDVKRSESNHGIVCHSHLRKVIVANMLQIHSEVAVAFLHTLKACVEGERIPPLEKPTLYSESAMAMRITRLACHVASYTGYGSYARALKYAMMGRAAFGLLLNKDVMDMILSMMPLLEEFNLRTPHDMLCVYYLGCKTELKRKHQPDVDEGVQLGVRARHCPDDILDTLGRYVSHAQWLYAAQLPQPHDAKEWGAWYLSRIIEPEGWQLIASNVDSIEMPDGSLCPAFALVVRNGTAREALLVIRGSSNLTDWRINVTRNVTTFSYRSGDNGSGVVTGGVHTGMLVAARAILDIFGMRKCMYMLLDNGFDLKIIGHSLGAGVASILAADLKNGLFRRRQLRASLKIDPSEVNENDMLSDTKFVYLGLDYENVHVQALQVADEHDLAPLPRVTAVCYATPPCVGENLANAFLEDKLVLSMINGDDIIPRLSGRNIQNLAEEIKSFSSTAELWMKEDEVRLKRYAKTVGKEGRMRPEHSTVQPTVPEAMNRSTSDNGFASSESTEVARSIADEMTGPVKEVRRFDRDNVVAGIPELNSPEPDLLIPERIGMASGISTPDVMVVPGYIAHFTKPRGVYEVSLCDYRMTTLSKISLLRDSIEEHYVSAHITALRSFKLARNAVERRVAPVWQKAYDGVTRQWARCSVCQSDPTWPYITNSDASRALVYHNCRACGKIVCVMCAPAGDSVPSSGVGEYQMLRDHRIPIPSLGILTPERVCMPCYLHCYNY